MQAAILSKGQLVLIEAPKPVPKQEEAKPHTITIK